MNTQTKILKWKRIENAHHKIPGTYPRSYINLKEDVVC